LNYFLGADEYDRLFVGFEILHIEKRGTHLERAGPLVLVKFGINIRGTSLSLPKQC